MPQPRSLFPAAVAVVQGVWLSVLVGRGWYSGPDLANISFAHGRDLDGGYLRASLGGHFGAPTRVLYWLLERADPLAWGVTVGVRVVLQGLATVLLWKLLVELVGPRRWLPAVLVVYAASAVLVPGISVLSSGIGLEISQAAFLGMLLLHVRYTRSGRLRQAVGVAVLALVALVYADQSAPGMLLLPMLSLGVLRTGSLWDQVRRRWAGWALLAGGAVVFAALYLSGDYTGTGSSFGPSLAWSLVRSEWVDVMGPALLGGPWDWYSFAGSWSPNASPPLVARVLGQVALLGLIVASLRVTGRRALYGWAVPVVIGIGGLVLVGVGRSELGTFIGVILRYSHFTPLALAIGVTLAFAAAPEERVVPRPLPLPAAARPLGAVALAGVLVMSVVSALGFADRFWDNPAPDYVANLTRTARTATDQFFDTWAPSSVIPGVEPNHFVSDVLVLTGERLQFDGLQPEPRMIDASGAAVAARILPVADLTDATTPGCGLPITSSTTVHLAPVEDENTWHLQLQLVQNRSNAFRIEVRDAAGRLLPFRHDTASVQPVGRLVAINRALVLGRPATVTLVAEDPGTSFCLVHAYVGSPFPT